MSFLKTTTTATVSETNDSRQNLLQWPQRPPRAGRISNPCDIILNTCSILLVLLIVVYIIFLCVYNGHDTNGIEGVASFLRQFSTLSPTAMPILFAFIVGRAIRTVAHWRLHHGERIGVLDLLYGSTTVISTITTIFDYGEFGLFAPLLIVVWTLSPLGAQSALRVLSFRPGATLSFQKLSYFNMSTPFPDTFVGASYGTYCAPVIALFLSSLGAPDSTKLSSLDTWGNIKVPYLEVLPDYKGPTSKDWVSINQHENGTNAPTYSSLIGLPMAGIPENDNTTFTIETSYLTFDCDSLTMVDDYLKASREISENSECTPKGNATCAMRMSWGYTATIPFPEGWTNDSTPRCDDPNPNARQFLYLDWSSTYNGTYATCLVQTSYVELQVECVGWDCVSTAIRPSLLETNPNPNNTYFDRQCERLGDVFSPFMQLLSQATKMQTTSSNSPSIIQSYLYNPSQVFNATALYSQPGLYTLDKSLFSLRLTQVINTYWMATAGSNALFLGHPSSYKSLMPSIKSGALDTMFFSTSNATISTAVVKIHTDFGWLVPLIISTLLMWTASMVTMAVDLQLGIPKMLMNLTSMTRGNPNFNLPPGGGGLTDETRGKLIRDIRVRFGRVEGNDPDDLVVGACIENGGTVAVAIKHKSSIQDNVI
ncbi:hypothetical protein QQX98_005170 [Neonectria punicea]|uniref:Uncharacterized protein n=1 Tax=Neonectria punicea TaxID=979145 RepID=A0ABR1H5W3_9HYPO